MDAAGYADVMLRYIGYRDRDVEEDYRDVWTMDPRPKRKEYANVNED